MSGKQGDEIQSRPFIGVHFSCCHVYQRIRLNDQGTTFVDWCPKCAGKIEVKVSPTGSKSRFLEPVFD